MSVTIANITQLTATDGTGVLGVRKYIKGSSNKKRTIPQICSYCGDLFLVPASSIKVGKGKYCSKECVSKSSIKKIKRNCVVCEVSFYVNPSILKRRNGGMYCSQFCFNVFRTKKYSLTCVYCGREFKVTTKRNSNNKFCSKECACMSRKTKIIRKCKICGSIFEVKLCYVKRGGGKYCSVVCLYKSRVLERSSRWKGGRKVCEIIRMMSPGYKLNRNISCLVRNGLKRGGKNGNHWEDLVGYSLDDLKCRLNETIPNGYSWVDFLESDKLHIDHIIPISAFDFSLPEHIDFRRCWALENLRLLPASENRKKHNKLIKPLQTALKLEVY